METHLLSLQQHGCCVYPQIKDYHFPHLLASERDTIRGVQFRVDAVRIYIYMYGGTCAIIVAHATLRSVGGVRPQPFFVCSNRFKRSNQRKRHGH